MSSFNFYMPVNIISGVDCLKNNGSKLILGKKCVIVTGKNSAKKCGALDDVTSVLNGASIPYAVFDKVTENPPAEMCREGGKFCRDFGADFIVAIGGGSPIDAAKAISAFAVFDAEKSDDIFKPEVMELPLLPIAAIPTTAGTGSEANSFSVLTLDSGLKKKTFKTPKAFPKIAFVDPKYTYSLSYEYTVSTALDAFCHSVESFMSPKSNDATEMFSLYGAKTVYDVLCKQDISNGFTEAQRESLMYASCAAGIGISHCGTGFTHPLGYSLTMSSGIPHGKACAAFTGEYISYNEKSPEGAAKLKRLYEYMSVSGEEIKNNIPALAGVNLKLAENVREEYIDRVSGAGNYANSPYKINRAEMSEIYTKLFS